MEVVKAILVFLAVLIFFTMLGWFSMGNEFFMVKYFSPKYEQVRTDTYRNSQAYQDGVVNELQKLQVEYANSQSQDAKDIIADTVVHKSATYPGPLPSSVAGFVAQCKRQKGIY